MSTPQVSPTTGMGQNTGAAGNQDFLDKGVDAGLKRAGHGQNASTTEKISDGIRSGFKKMTGKDVPIKDKQ
ncbi:hypothetical protein FFLO_05258 [Filobasidium floriforme]|uniref:Uncharacterized protein n=1 Tax=Filobasidium floriforme TaxID=5210 RepID=A0A8K0NRI1_9TREE|nr:uncharacterized protein HD553DRAFT_346116 [Filobasidium floriforme]KAG7530099.1 hypothetical protein FFLO_05258 [Filobasidium floriforme]KAH8078219.1 hypothetical protein HD553DRAFT_346116 [Filobasidium floriforme]